MEAPLDPGACLLHQKLQMLQLCILRRQVSSSHPVIHGERLLKMPAQDAGAILLRSARGAFCNAQIAAGLLCERHCRQWSHKILNHLHLGTLNYS